LTYMERQLLVGMCSALKRVKHANIALVMLCFM
jgi:hypothetical protein